MAQPSPSSNGNIGKPAVATDNGQVRSTRRITSESLALERALELETTNIYLRKRIIELEGRLGAGGDIGDVLFRALVETFKTMTPTQQVEMLAARVSTLETQNKELLSLRQTELERHADAERVAHEQLALLNASVEAARKQTDELRALKRDLRDMQETIDRLKESEKRAREDATRDADQATKLQEELLHSRSERIDAMQKLHNKYKEEISVLESNLRQVQGQIQDKNRELEAVVSTASQKNSSDSMQNLKETLNSIVTNLHTIDTNIMTITTGFATKLDLAKLVESFEEDGEKAEAQARVETLLTQLRGHIATLAEEYGAEGSFESMTDIELISVFKKAIQATLRGYEERSKQEEKRREGMRQQYDKQTQEMQRAQDKLVSSMEFLMEELHRVGTARGASDAQIAAVAKAVEARGGPAANLIPIVPASGASSSSQSVLSNMPNTSASTEVPVRHPLMISGSIASVPEIQHESPPTSYITAGNAYNVFPTTSSPLAAAALREQRQTNKDDKKW